MNSEKLNSILAKFHWLNKRSLEATQANVDSAQTVKNCTDHALKYATLLAETAEKLLIENERLTQQVETLKHELRWANSRNAERNRQLDALHFVWCNGGCEAGVHRWTEEKITEEIVLEAERNTQRLRSWFNNNKFKRENAPKEGT